MQTRTAGFPRGLMFERTWIERTEPQPTTMEPIMKSSKCSQYTKSAFWFGNGSMSDLGTLGGNAPHMSGSGCELTPEQFESWSVSTPAPCKPWRPKPFARPH
jgi:hypothetical protein